MTTRRLPKEVIIRSAVENNGLDGVVEEEGLTAYFGIRIDRDGDGLGNGNEKKGGIQDSC